MVWRSGRRVLKATVNRGLDSAGALCELLRQRVLSSFWQCALSQDSLMRSEKATSMFSLFVNS